MEHPLVSTITPCYRMGKYLRLFLEQLPLQTCFDRLEVVLDHNEPTAEELGWVRAFQHQYPGKIKHIIVHPVEPIGVSMNRCIREARGEFLTIWNVDDLRTPDSIEVQAAALQKHREEDICHGPFRVVKKFGSTEGPLSNDRSYPTEELARSMLLGPFFMFRKSLISKTGIFDEQLRSGADFDFAIRLALHGRVLHILSPLGFYLNEGLGASTRPRSLQPIERTLIELRYGIYDKIDYSYVAEATRYNIPYLLQEGNWRPVSDFVPDYDAFIKKRGQLWKELGLRRYGKRALWRHSRAGQALRRTRQWMQRHPEKISQ